MQPARVSRIGLTMPRAPHNRPAMNGGAKNERAMNGPFDGGVSALPGTPRRAFPTVARARRREPAILARYGNKRSLPRIYTVTGNRASSRGLLLGNLVEPGVLPKTRQAWAWFGRASLPLPDATKANIEGRRSCWPAVVARLYLQKGCAEALAKSTAKKNAAKANNPTFANTRGEGSRRGR